MNSDPHQTAKDQKFIDEISAIAHATSGMNASYRAEKLIKEGADVNVRVTSNGKIATNENTRPGEKTYSPIEYFIKEAPAQTTAPGGFNQTDMDRKRTVTDMLEAGAKHDGTRDLALKQEKGYLAEVIGKHDYNQSNVGKTDFNRGDLLRPLIGQSEHIERSERLKDKEQGFLEIVKTGRMHELMSPFDKTDNKFDTIPPALFKMAAAEGLGSQVREQVPLEKLSNKQKIAFFEGEKTYRENSHSTVLSEPARMADAKPPSANTPGKSTPPSQSVTQQEVEAYAREAVTRIERNPLVSPNKLMGQVADTFSNPADRHIVGNGNGKVDTQRERELIERAKALDTPEGEKLRAASKGMQQSQSIGQTPNTNPAHRSTQTAPIAPGKTTQYGTGESSPNAKLTQRTDIQEPERSNNPQPKNNPLQTAPKSREEELVKSAKGLNDAKTHQMQAHARVGTIDNKIREVRQDQPHSPGRMQQAMGKLKGLFADKSGAQEHAGKSDVGVKTTARDLVTKIADMDGQGSSISQQDVNKATELAQKNAAVAKALGVEGNANAESVGNALKAFCAQSGTKIAMDSSTVKTPTVADTSAGQSAGRTT